MKQEYQIDKTNVYYEMLSTNEPINESDNIVQAIYFDVLEGFVEYARNKVWSKKGHWKNLKSKRQVIIILDTCYR